MGPSIASPDSGFNVLVPFSSVSSDHRPDGPLDLGRTLGPLRRGSGDPCMRIGAADVVRATRTTAGPATLRLRHDPDAGVVRAQAWGPGAQRAIDGVGALLGERSEAPCLVELIARVDGPERRLLHDLARRHVGVRVPRSGAVAEALVPVILEQRVTGGEARRSYGSIVRTWGEPAPGPADLVAGLMVPPDPVILARTPAWAFHPHGVERKRADAIRLTCRHAGRLDETPGMDIVAARRRLAAIPGVGPWTIAEAGRVALGDADAVSVGDFHLPHQVAWAFRGRARSSDDEMLELLEPYRGDRGRIIRLVELSGIGAPRFGPRKRIAAIRAL